jgi:uncharacterized membrane protein YqjE
MQNTHNGPSSTDHRSIGELARALSRDAAALVRAELQLARLEMTEKARQSAVAGGLIATALVMVLAAVGTLTAAAVIALALAVPAWLAALIVAALLLIAAAVMARVAAGRLQAATPPMPSDTVESAKEDVQWLKHQATSGPR